MECELCAFNNPKPTATAAILRGNALLVLRRAQEPFLGMFDLPGGFLNAGEVPETAMHRELREELGVDAKELIFAGAFSGTHQWKEKTLSIFSSLFLVDIGDQKIKLSEENSQFEWMSLSQLNPADIPIDSNRDIVKWLKEKCTFDLARVRELVTQLDTTALVNEFSLYKAILNGFVSTKYDPSTSSGQAKKLIGMGWIFPRQTMLRKQAIVEDMIVDEAYRGKGLGRELLDDLVKWARSQNVEMIELTSNPKRIAANELYKKYGFQLHPTNHYLYRV